jgi:hypothetical protein
VILNPPRSIKRIGEDGSFRYESVPGGAYELLYCNDFWLVERIRFVMETDPVHVDFQAIPGDLNRDGKIDLLDAVLFSDRLGQEEDDLDLNRDGEVTRDDLDAWYDVAWHRMGYWSHFALLDDAEHETPNGFYPEAGRWQTIHDNGDSWSDPSPFSPVYPEAGGYYSQKSIRFQYRLGSQATYPYCLIRYIFGENDSVILDARDLDGVTVVLKGEGQPLIVSLKSAVTSDDFAEYYTRIPALSPSWQAYTFRFREDFRQVEWGERESISEVLSTLQAVQFKADDRYMDRSATVLIDDLCLLDDQYAPFPAEVSGTCVVNGEGVPGIVVTLSGAEMVSRALSGLDGRFIHPDMRPGLYTLSMARPGFGHDAMNRVVIENAHTDLGNRDLERTVPEQKPLSRGSFRVTGRELQADLDGDGFYLPWYIKGVGYAPTPIGSWGDLIYPEAVYDRDMPLLRDMYCNTIRTWGKANRLLLDKALSMDVHLLCGFWVNTGVDFFDPRVRMEILDEFKDYVSDLKDHEGVLGWSLGNEQNYVNGDNWAWYSLVQDLAVTAFMAEGERYHPVAVPNGDILRIGHAGYLTRDLDMSYLDIWGMNLYKPDREGFQPTFLLYSAFSEKPLWISEYGIDAYDNRNHTEYEDRQAMFAGNRLREMARSPVCIGSTIMAYSDEWWKAGNPDSHDTGGYPTTAHPDGFSNEEWYGIFRVEKRVNETDRLIKRTVRDTLAGLFENYESIRNISLDIEN